MPSVLQKWVSDISMMQQTVLLTAIRGPDGIAKYSKSKFLLRWYRRCVVLSAMDGKVLDNPYDANGGSFTGPSCSCVDDEDWEEFMDGIVGEYLTTLDELPHHFQLHLIHAIEILGYKHPVPRIRAWWNRVYKTLVNDMHLMPETEEELDQRLGDSREQWLKRNHPATVS